jgi:cytochrome P450
MSTEPPQAAMVDFDDLLSDAAVNHPFPFLARQRDHDPVYWNERWNGWVVTSYDDVVNGFRNHGRLSSDRFAGPFAEEWREEGSEVPPSLLQFLSRFFVWKDPPYHKRMRGLVAQAFTARSVEVLRPRIAALVDELVAPLREREEVEFLSEFAFHLPVIVITEYLGIPSHHRNVIKQWSDDLGSVIFVRGNDAERFRRAGKAVDELAAFLAPLVEARRRQPRNDLLTGLVQADEHGDHMSDDEIIATVILMVFAGHETTMNLLGNAVVAFDQHPEEWQRLREQPRLGRTAAEEMLRYDGPIRAMARWAKEPFELGGKHIKRYDRVLLHQAAANHDGAAFAEPDRFDITRRPNRHVAFGQGIHTCLGGPLARLEAQETYLYLTRHYDAIEILEPELRYHPTIVSRSLQRLRVRFVERSA